MQDVVLGSLAGQLTVTIDMVYWLNIQSTHADLTKQLAGRVINSAKAPKPALAISYLMQFFCRPYETDEAGFFSFWPDLRPSPDLIDILPGRLINAWLKRRLSGFPEAISGCDDGEPS